MVGDYMGWVIMPSPSFIRIAKAQSLETGNMIMVNSTDETGNALICSECQRTVEHEKICIIDDKPVCVRCVYGQEEPFEIYPIGMVKNDLQRRDTGFSTTGPRGISRIELLKSQKRFMHKLGEEEFLTIVYYLHQAKSVKSIFKRGLDGKEVGVFASRTPDRLSRIAIRDVKLIKIERTTLYVEGLDAIDGTPVLDIKLKI